MSDPLAPLISDGIVEDVISRLKTGKEAEIFVVQHAGEICAAKVYKDRHARSFRNNAAYKEGRTSRNSRTQRAMDTGTRFGQQASEDAWKAKEFEALQKLHGAGVRVPRPLMLYEGVLLMEIVIDAEGHPAPRLIDAAIPRERAAEYYADLRQQAIRILRSDLIHGDLSPYNVLLAWNGPTLIDFPQVVGAAHNSQAAFFFHRDIETLHRFFTSIDPSLSASAHDAQEIWRAYERGQLTDDFIPTGHFVESRKHKPRNEHRPSTPSTPKKAEPSRGQHSPGHGPRHPEQSRQAAAPGHGGQHPPRGGGHRATQPSRGSQGRPAVEASGRRRPHEPASQARPSRAEGHRPPISQPGAPARPHGGPTRHPPTRAPHPERAMKNDRGGQPRRNLPVPAVSYVSRPPVERASHQQSSSDALPKTDRQGTVPHPPPSEKG